MDTLWAYEFLYSEDLDAVGSCEDYHSTDDFQVGDATLKGFECWCVYSVGGPVYSFLLTIYENNNGHPGNTNWSAHVTNVTFTDTGYEDPHIPGAPIFHCEMLLDEQDYLYLPEYETYWSEIYQEELQISERELADLKQRNIV